MKRVAVVGHVEWVDFLAVESLPRQGQITPARRVRINAAGGAVVAATVLARLGAEVDFYGAIGSDDLGRRAVQQLETAGIRVHCAVRPGPTRQVITFIQTGGERSIVVIGERLQPAGDDALAWERLSGCDGVYVTAGDAGVLRAARAARVLCATPRIAERLQTLPVELDALIYSGEDHAEVALAAQLAGRARLEVVTDGASGGHWTGASSGSWAPVPVPGPVVDAYGAGDSFAAGFTFGMAMSGDPAEGARVGAEVGAAALSHPGGP